MFDVVHRAGGYDVEVDTSLHTPDEAAATIVEALSGGFPATPFGRWTSPPNSPAAEKSVDPRRVERPALGTAQPGAGVLADVADVVATLLEDHEPLAERGRPAARTRGRRAS